MTAPCALGMLAAILTLGAALAILIPLAFGQAEVTAGAAVEWRGPHSDHVIAAGPDGRSATARRESIPMPRQEVNGTWAPYAIERTRSGAVEFKGGSLNLRFERADCSVRMPDLGRVCHSLLTAPPSGGAWRVYDTTYAECALAIDLVDLSRLLAALPIVPASTIVMPSDARTVWRVPPAGRLMMRRSSATSPRPRPA